MNVKIDIDTRTFIRFWLVVVGLALLALLIIKARSALIIVGASIFLALALNPSVTRLAKILPGKSRGISTAIAYVVIIALLGAFLFLAVPPIVDQTSKVVTAVPQWVNEVSKHYSGIGDFVQRHHLQAQLDSAVASAKEYGNKIGQNVGSTLVSGIGSFFAFMTAGILTLVITFFILIEGPTWLHRLWGLYADKKKMKYHRDVMQRLYSVVTGYVSGQLVVSALDGLAAGLCVAILSFIFNVPLSFAIPTAVIAFVFSLIPLFGATIGAILVGLMLAFNDIWAAIIYILFVIVYQQVESNFIVPKIQSKRLDLSGLVVLVSVTIGIYLFGIVGGIISIPIAGCIKVLVEEYISYVQSNRTKNGHAHIKATEVDVEAD